ncbi:MAG: DUF1566 domain-containing protein [Deltaproteobacteria bacterium]|nr:DUF1566 domain-containing protein [Deltaproteobacteria bacterium]
MRKSLGLILIFLLLIPGFGFAANLDEALERVAVYLKGKLEAVDSKKKLEISVVNIYTKESDELAKKIKNGLYLALDQHFPKGRVIEPTESLSGSSINNAVLIKGKYEIEGNETTLRFKIINAQDGSILATTRVSYDSKKEINKTLVAVLDIDTSDLNQKQKRIFSRIFRSAITRNSNLSIVSSAEVDKFNPDQIQKALNCTREECAVKIGEQLGVDQVVSVNYTKIASNLYFLSATMVLTSGEINASAEIKHNGDLGSLNEKLVELAKQLVGNHPKPTPATTTPQIPPKPKADLYVVTIDEKTGLMWQDNNYEELHSWRNAMDYCASLTLSGYADWRLPNKEELQVLYQHRNRLKSYKADFYWSSTTYAGNTTVAWDVGFYDGGVSNVNKANGSYVRCVR